jgi:hypothetical protein
MKTATSVLLCLFFCSAVWAQTEKGKPAGKTASAAAPDDISGMYSFLKDGEFVQITVEDQGSVTGFISRFGDLPSDHGAFLDQFIKKGTLDGTKLAFTTDPVHGVSYEFQGTVERGPGKTPGDQAYYVLRGRLTESKTDAQHTPTARSSEVEFKSFPRDVVIDRPKRD